MTVLLGLMICGHRKMQERIEIMSRDMVVKQ